MLSELLISFSRCYKEYFIICECTSSLLKRGIFSIIAVHADTNPRHSSFMTALTTMPGNRSSRNLLCLLVSAPATVLLFTERGRFCFFLPVPLIAPSVFYLSLPRLRDGFILNLFHGTGRRLHATSHLKFSEFKQDCVWVRRISRNHRI